MQAGGRYRPEGFYACMSSVAKPLLTCLKLTDSAPTPRQPQLIWTMLAMAAGSQHC